MKLFVKYLKCQKLAYLKNSNTYNKTICRTFKISWVFSKLKLQFNKAWKFVKFSPVSKLVCIGLPPICEALRTFRRCRTVTNFLLRNDILICVISHALPIDLIRISMNSDKCMFNGPKLIGVGAVRASGRKRGRHSAYKRSSRSYRGPHSYNKHFIQNYYFFVFVEPKRHRHQNCKLFFDFSFLEVYIDILINITLIFVFFFTFLFEDNFVLYQWSKRLYLLSIINS